MAVIVHRSACNRSKTLEPKLPYELSEIPEPLKCWARTELFEDEDTRIHSLKLLRSLLKDEPDLHWQDEDLFLLSFLRSRKFDVQRAFHRMKNFYAQKYKYKELFVDFNFQDVKRTLEGNGLGFLPYRDSDGSVIFLLSATHWNPSEHTLGDVMRALTCALLHANLSPATQIAGFKIIFNCDGLSLKHLPHISPSYVWLMAEAIQDYFPGRFITFIIVNDNPISTSFWMIVKHFLTKKMRDRFHFCGKNIKKIHKYISPSVLPADLEGELPPYDNTEWRQSVEEKADYLTHVFSHGYTKPGSKSQEKE